MSKKRYTIKSACPQCGCTDLTALTEAEIQAKYGDDPKARMTCGECLEEYTADMKSACPEWDAECRLKERKK